MSKVPEKARNIDIIVEFLSCSAMPPKVRSEHAGAMYHVMARGNRCADIVFDDQDRKTSAWSRFFSAALENP